MTDLSVIHTMMADILYDIGYCQDWAVHPHKDEIILVETFSQDLGETEALIPFYKGDDKECIKIAVAQITTLEQWLIRSHFDLWSKYSLDASMTEGNNINLLDIVQSVVLNCFIELYASKH